MASLALLATAASVVPWAENTAHDSRLSGLLASSLANAPPHGPTLKVGVSNVVIAASLLAAYVYLRHFVDTRSDDVDLLRTHTVQVRNVPILPGRSPHTVMHELGEFLTRHYGRVLHVTLVRNLAYERMAAEWTARRARLATHVTRVTGLLGERGGESSRDIPLLATSQSTDASSDDGSVATDASSASETRLRVLPSTWSYVAFVTFAESFSAVFCLRAHVRATLVHYYRRPPFFGRILHIARPPTMSDIRWRDITSGLGVRIARQVAAYGISLSVLGGTTTGVVFLVQARNAKAHADFGFAFLTAFVVAINSIFITVFFRWWSTFEKQHTWSQLNTSIYIKVLIFELVNLFVTVFLGLRLQVAVEDNLQTWLELVAPFIILTICVDALQRTVVGLVQPVYRLRKFVLWRVLSESARNEVRLGPKLGLPEAFASSTKVVIFSLILGPIVPVAYVLTFVSLTLAVLVYRFNLLYQFRKQPRSDQKLTRHAISVLPFVALGHLVAASVAYTYQFMRAQHIDFNTFFNFNGSQIDPTTFLPPAAMVTIGGSIALFFALFLTTFFRFARLVIYWGFCCVCFYRFDDPWCCHPFSAGRFRDAILHSHSHTMVRDDGTHAGKRGADSGCEQDAAQSDSGDDKDASTRDEPAVPLVDGGGRSAYDTHASFGSASGAPESTGTADVAIVPCFPAPPHPDGSTRRYVNLVTVHMPMFRYSSEGAADETNTLEWHATEVFV